MTKSRLKVLAALVLVAPSLYITGMNSYTTSAATVADYEYGYGPISSMNNGWILAGNYMGYSNPSNLSDSGFHATFSMVLENGTAYHVHKISNATIDDVQIDRNNTTMYGTVTVTMRDGSISNIPTNWTVNNNNTLAISMDPSKINNHFGNTSIYGIEFTPEKAMEIRNIMAEDSEFMDKWTPIMVQDTMNAFKIKTGNISDTSIPNQFITNESMGIIFKNNSAIP
jgi:hypothetical protein